MAEMHPILWTRITDRRLSHPHVRVAVLSTFTNRSSDLADLPIVFRPGSDLAIMNYIANYIISTGRVNQEFVERHTPFMTGTTNIGYGLSTEDPREVAAPGAPRPGDMESGRASCRERVGRAGKISVVGVAFKKKENM